MFFSIEDATALQTRSTFAIAPAVQSHAEPARSHREPHLKKAVAPEIRVGARCFRADVPSRRSEFSAFGQSLHAL